MDSSPLKLLHSNHRLLLLQKKAVRIITNQDYIAHSEPLCKLLNVLKVSDLFVCSLWKFCYKLTKKELPTYFDIMLPTLPNVCDYYNIRRPIFHLPFIKHGFAEQRLDYQYFVDMCGVEGKRRLCELNVTSLSPALATRHIRCVLLVNSPNKLNLLSWLLIFLCNK